MFDIKYDLQRGAQKKGVLLMSLNINNVSKPVSFTAEPDKEKKPRWWEKILPGEIEKKEKAEVAKRPNPYKPEDLTAMIDKAQRDVSNYVSYPGVIVQREDAMNASQLLVLNDLSKKVEQIMGQRQVQSIH